MPTDRCQACGQHHRDSPVDRVVIGHGTTAGLLELLDERAWGRVLVVSDVNTDAAWADTTAERLRRSGHHVARLSFPQAEGLLADEAAVDAVARVIAADPPDAAVVVGSGTLNDITRYATYRAGIPYASVPTAASMDGYASGVAAMQFGGTKATFPAQPPVGIFAELEVLTAAPSAMTGWGLGDLLGKATARFDWLLAAAVTGETFCPVIEQRVLDPLNRCLERPALLLDGNPDGIEALLRGLIESGIAMAMLGTSRPASGAEHHMSHFWDLLAYRGRRPHAPHGLQVAYATGLVMTLQRNARERLQDPLAVSLGQEPTDEERQWYGQQIDSPQIMQVRRAKATAFPSYAHRWPPDPTALGAARETLDEALAPFHRVYAALAAAGVPTGAGFLDIDTSTAVATIRYANRIRDRFTALDLLEAQGHLAELAAAVAPSWG